MQVSIGNPEKMEPITNVSQIPSNRWALICCLCKEKTGACIQVRVRKMEHKGLVGHFNDKTASKYTGNACKYSRCFTDEAFSLLCSSAQQKTAGLPFTSPAASTPASK